MHNGLNRTEGGAVGDIYPDWKGIIGDWNWPDYLNAARWYNDTFGIDPGDSKVVAQQKVVKWLVDA
jgi:hypothetical protein